MSVIHIADTGLFVAMGQRSNQTMVREGQTVRFRAAAKSWYQGRCSLVLTGWSRIEFPERRRWWDE